jgi:hypothetical protein
LNHASDPDGYNAWNQHGHINRHFDWKHPDRDNDRLRHGLMTSIERRCE